MNNLNGMPVIGRTESTIFVRLPEALQRSCGGCSCAYCRANPELEPRWDTLAVATAKPASGADTVWTVHMPDPGAVRRAIVAGVMRGPFGATVVSGRLRP